ncbi:hypothetical protein IID22_00555 [Patescibacteria group bacterium]|nr:hypothetical protein [Patescibacteria group bacterium]
MKKSELTKLRSKKADVLEKIVADRRLDLVKVSADIKASKEKNLKKAKNLRRDLSQILTLISEKELTEKETRSSEQVASAKQKNQSNKK